MSDRVLVALPGGEDLLIAAFRREADELRAGGVEGIPSDTKGEELTAARQRLARRRWAGRPAVLVVPGRELFIRFCRPSVRGERAVRSTILYELEEGLPVPVEDLTGDFDRAAGPRGEGEVVVACARRQNVADGLDRLAGLGLSPVAAVPAVAALANGAEFLGDGGAGLWVHLGRGEMVGVLCGPDGLREAWSFPDGDSGPEPWAPLLRSAVLTASLEEEPPPLRVSGGPPERLKAAREAVTGIAGVTAEEPPWVGAGGGELEPEEREALRRDGPLLVGAAAGALGLAGLVSLDLAGRRRRIRGSLKALKRPLRWAAILLGVVLLLWVVEGLAVRRRSVARIAATRAELADLWHERHPGRELPLDPVRTLRAETAGAEPVSVHGTRRLGVLHVLERVVGAATGEGEALPYRRLRVSGEGVAVEGIVRDYAAADALLGRLEERGFEAGPPEMTAREGRVAFRVELERTPEE
ncbi:MAG: type II secretion system protein GspL [Longimicrobiales bacterium]